MVEHQPSKLKIGFRLSLSAPNVPFTEFSTKIMALGRNVMPSEIKTVILNRVVVRRNTTSEIRYFH